MLKKLRSARFSVPAARCASRRSVSSCSLMWYEAIAAARTRRSPQETRVTMRASGRGPPVGHPNSAIRSGSAGSSTVVPSKAVSSKPKAKEPVPGAGPAAAPASNRCRTGSSPTRVRARDSAAPVGTAPPTMAAPPSSGHPLKPAPPHLRNRRTKRPGRPSTPPQRTWQAAQTTKLLARGS